MKTKMITSPDGTQIAYDISGQGPALILLHGAGKTRQDWHKLGYAERFQNNFTVITVDIRGTGESDYLVEIEDYAIEKIYQDLYGGVAGLFPGDAGLAPRGSRGSTLPDVTGSWHQKQECDALGRCPSRRAGTGWR